MRPLAIIFILCALAACAGAAEQVPSSGPTGQAGGPAIAPSAPVVSPGGVPAATGTSTAVPPSAAASPVTNAGATPGTPPSAAANPATAAQSPASTTTTPTGNPSGGGKLATDECGLHTQYAGDEYCILPPPADKGFQLHVGPADYDHPDPKYVLQPGQENVTNFSVTSGNDKEVQYYYRQYRMRPGSHHVILTGNGKSMGGTQNLARDNPVNGVVPPENADIGLSLPAHTQISANMHGYNFTDKPIIRELWVNYWYKDPATVKQTAKSVFSMTGVSAAVAHSHVVVGASCAVTGSGHVLTLSGHRHLNNVRFSIWHTSGGQKTLVLDDYDSEHPASLEFNSLTTNTPPNPMMKVTGGTSGIINLVQGDTLDFECEIVNNTNKNFFGANEAADDEMCILTGDTVGASVPGSCTPIAARKIN
jgi:hypothetical protein